MDVRKAVKAVAVGALAISGAVGILVAQDNIKSPWATTTVNQVDIVDGNRGTRVQMEASLEISNRAAMVVVPNIRTSLLSLDRVLRVDTLHALTTESIDPLDVLGNVGFLAVESNMGGWDLLVTLKNGGRLVRAPGDGESGDTISAAYTVCDTSYDFNFNLVETCEEFPAETSAGVSLKYQKAGVVDWVPLKVGVGILKNGVYVDPAAPLAIPQFKPGLLQTGVQNFDYTGAAFDATDPVDIDAVLDFPIANRYTGSVAEAISAIADNTDSRVLAAFGAAFEVGDLDGIAAADGDPGFPAIASGHEFNLYNLDPAKLPAEGSRDQTMFFSVTAGLDMWDYDGTDYTATGKLLNNKNGIYTETLTVTFWGMYQ